MTDTKVPSRVFRGAKQEAEAVVAATNVAEIHSRHIAALEADIAELEADLIIARLPPAPEPVVEPYTDAMLCHAVNIFHEARDQSVKGQRLVAQTVENRIGMREKWTDVCAVVFADSQFSWTEEKPYIDLSDAIERDAFRKALNLAEAASTGEMDLGDEGITHYYNPDKADPPWRTAFVQVVAEGDHAFFK